MTSRVAPIKRGQEVELAKRTAISAPQQVATVGVIVPERSAGSTPSDVWGSWIDPICKAVVFARPDLTSSSRLPVSISAHKARSEQTSAQPADVDLTLIYYVRSLHVLYNFDRPPSVLNQVHPRTRCWEPTVVTPAECSEAWRARVSTRRGSNPFKLVVY